MKRSVLLLVRLYVAFSILQPLLLSVFLKPIHFFGAASLTYLFQFSLGNGKGTFLSVIDLDGRAICRNGHKLHFC